MESDLSDFMTDVTFITFLMTWIIKVYVYHIDLSSESCGLSNENHFCSHSNIYICIL